MLSACDRTEASSTSESPQRRPFIVDAPEVSYVYYDRAQRPHTVGRLAAIPDAARSIVIIFSGETPTRGDVVYTVDLEAAHPGERLVARRASLAQTKARVYATLRSRAIGRDVVFFAQERTQLDDRSNRSKRSRRLLQELKADFAGESSTK